MRHVMELLNVQHWDRVYCSLLCIVLRHHVPFCKQLIHTRVFIPAYTLTHSSSHYVVRLKFSCMRYEWDASRTDVKVYIELCIWLRLGWARHRVLEFPKIAFTYVFSFVGYSRSERANSYTHTCARFSRPICIPNAVQSPSTHPHICIIIINATK